MQKMIIIQMRLIKQKLKFYKYSDAKISLNQYQLIMMPFADSYDDSRVELQ